MSRTASIPSSRNATAGETSPNSDRLVVIGGSGDVGRRFLRLLGRDNRWQVSVVSRRGDMPGWPSSHFAPLAIDIRTPDAGAAIPDGATVINLTEATPPALIMNVVARGGTVLDTSATPAYVEALANAAGSGVLVLCVGAAPGLSTLLAADLGRRPDVAAIDIGLELGMGRHYGPAATEWFFRALGVPYRDETNRQKIAPGALRRSFAFVRNARPRPALGVGFSDRGILPPKSAARVRTYLAVDPSLVTRLVGALLSLGLGPWASRRALTLARVTKRLPGFGPVRTRIAAEAVAADGRQIAASHFDGGDQAELTAAIILITLHALRTDCGSPME